MDFAFGEVTPKKFIYNYVAQWKDLRSSSMCACFEGESTMDLLTAFLDR